MAMVEVRRGNTHLIGREVRFSDRIRWVRISEKDENNCITAKWWPAVIYESYGELQKDINPEYNSFRAKVLVKRKKQEISGKNITPVAFLLGFDREVLIEISMTDPPLRNETSHAQPQLNVITPHAKQSYLFQPSSPILQSLESSRKILDFYISYDEIMASSGRPHRISSKDSITYNPILRQTTKREFSRAVDYALHALDTEIHTDDIGVPTKPQISITSNDPFISSETKSNKKTKIPRNIQESASHSKPESPITVERTPSTQGDEISIQPKDPWSTTWEKMKALGWTNVQISGVGGTCYLPPGKTKSKGTENVDYFTSESAVQDFIRYKYNWIGDDNSIGDEATPQNNGQNQIYNTVYEVRSPSNSTSDVNALHPRIIGTPIVPEDPWMTVWDKLKYSGWTWRHGGGLVSYYYFPPGKSQPIGIDGIDYFTSEEAVKDFVREKFNWIGQKEPSRKRAQRLQKASIQDRKKKKYNKKRPTKENIDSKRKKKKTNRVTLDENDFKKQKEIFSSRENKEDTHFPSEVEVFKTQNKQNEKPNNGRKKKNKYSEEESLMTEEKKNSSKKKSKSKSSLGGRSWGEVTNTKETKQNKNTKIVNLTPEGKTTEKKDPSKPVFSSSSETSIDSFTKYCWKNLWADLKMEGWTVISALKYNKLHDWYYMKPNCDPALPQFQLGRDYFQFGTDVIEYIRKLDKEKRTKRKSKRVTLDSISGEAANNVKPQASSRRNAVISEFDKEAAVESSVIEGSICTPENNSPFTPSSSVISESEYWWLYEPIPKSAKIWPILSKLGFKYLSGMYCLPGITTKTIEPGIYSFSDQQDLAKLLSVQGIPNLFSEDGRSNLNRSDEETILKWVSVAQLPTGINSINSLSMLSKVPILSDFEAWNILHQKLRYSFEDGNYYLPLKSKSAFQSLEELKHHIRGHGLQVDRKLQKGMRKNFELLGVILWASRAPLPKHKMAERLDCYGTGHKVSANVQPDEKKNDIAKIQMHNDTKNEKDKTVGLPTHAENIERTNDAVGDKCDRDNKEVKVVDENVDSGILEELNPETSIREDKSVSLEESLSTKNMTVTINRDATIDEVSSLEKQRNSSFSESSEQSEGEEVYHDTVENKKSPNAVVGEEKVKHKGCSKNVTFCYEDAIEVLREEEKKNDLHYEPSIIVDNGSTDKMKVGSHLPDEQNDKVQGNSFFFTQPLQDNEDGFDGDAAHGYPWLL